MRSIVAATLPAILATGLLATGCACPDLRGPGFNDEMGSWAKKLRPPADQSKFSGIDARSREIESNLGVR